MPQTAAVGQASAVLVWRCVSEGHLSRATSYSICTQHRAAAQGTLPALYLASRAAFVGAPGREVVSQAMATVLTVRPITRAVRLPSVNARARAAPGLRAVVGGNCRLGACVRGTGATLWGCHRR